MTYALFMLIAIEARIIERFSLFQITASCWACRLHFREMYCCDIFSFSYFRSDIFFQQASGISPTFDYGDTAYSSRLRRLPLPHILIHSLLIASMRISPAIMTPWYQPCFHFLLRGDIFDDENIQLAQHYFSLISHVVSLTTTTRSLYLRPANVPLSLSCLRSLHALPRSPRFTPLSRRCVFGLLFFRFEQSQYFGFIWSQRLPRMIFAFLMPSFLSGLRLFHYNSAFRAEYRSFEGRSSGTPLISICREMLGDIGQIFLRFTMPGLEESFCQR